MESAKYIFHSSMSKFLSNLVLIVNFLFALLIFNNLSIKLEISKVFLPTKEMLTLPGKFPIDISKMLSIIALIAKVTTKVFSNC